MGDPDWCNNYKVSYQSLPRTIAEALLCLLIVAAYVPQYIAIITQGTHGISSRYILFHGLFSVFTLALRVCHPIFFNAFNCVNGGPYTGWKALSSLLGIIQCIVQFVAAMVLVGLYVRYRSSDAVPGQPLIEVEAPSPDLSGPSLRAIQIAVGATAAVVLPVSFAFLFLNQHPWFDPDVLTDLWFIVYVLGLSSWRMLLLLANTCFLVLPFMYQVKIVYALHDSGTLSFVSLAMQAVAFGLLAVMQAARNWSSIVWMHASDFRRIGRFLESFFALYSAINTHVAYLLTGVACLVLFVVCLLEKRQNAAGRIRL